LCIQIECALEQLEKTGKKETISFKAEKYEDMYSSHLDAIMEWKDKFPVQWGCLERDLKAGIW